MVAKARPRSQSKSPRGKSPGRPRTPTRPKTPVRGRSPSVSIGSSRSRSVTPEREPKPKARKSRSKSVKKSPKAPARSRSRSKSPGRAKATARPKTAKAPAPARSRSATRGRARTKSVEKNASKKSKEIEIDVIDLAIAQSKIPDFSDDEISPKAKKAEITKQTPKKQESTNLKPETSGLRRSARVASNEEEVAKEVQSLIANNKSSDGPKRAFGTTIGVVLQMILVPGVFMLLNLACTKEQCLLKSFRIPTTWQTYLNRDAGLLYVGFVVFQFILALLPIGSQVDPPPSKAPRHKVRCNAFFAAIVTLSILAGLYQQKYNVDIVYEKFFQLLVTSILFGILASLALFIYGGRASVSTLNPEGVTGSRVYDFYAGRQINPVFFRRIDFKLIFHRITILAVLVLNVVILLKGVSFARKEYPPTLLISAGLQIAVALDYCWFEESFLYSFEYQREGAGYQSVVGYALWPFVPTIITKFILEQRVELSIYALALIVIVHNFGYVIYRASTAQKTGFRKNPLKPSLAHLETIPTSLGKKLLASGWWGWVRHPNYLGVLIMHLCWTATCGYSHALPYVFPLLTLLMVLARAVRVEGRCRQRYGPAWDRYCSHVKYHVIPRIF